MYLTLRYSSPKTMKPNLNSTKNSNPIGHVGDKHVHTYRIKH